MPKSAIMGKMELKQKNNLFSLITAGKRVQIMLFLPVFLSLFCFLGLSLPLKNVQAAESSPVYRFYSSNNKAYFYTISQTEKDKVIANYSDNEWKYEGIKFYAYKNQEGDLKPVYRFWSSKNRSHFYTISQTEKDKLISNYSDYEWKYEGIAFYAYTEKSDSLTAVYRLYDSKYHKHFFTTSPGERNCLLNNFSGQWKDEGTAWWVPEEGADLSADETSCGVTYGPEISVGLWSHSRSELEDEAFRIHANKNYNIKNKDGKIIAKVSAGAETRVKYNGDGKLKIYNSISSTIVDKEIRFDAVDGNNSSMIFDAHRPSSSFDKYRGKIKVRYSSTTKKIWIINNLPLEQYAWGNGEITGTGDADYNRAMATVYRTYGYWKIKYSTKYATEGFKVTSTSSSQIYSGYEWEEDHPKIKQAVQETKGKISKYKDEIALSPYSSWTDGRTRSFEERWGSDDYPWCQSVKDPYGKHPTMTTSQLVAAGNHMVGISAHGALHVAGEHDWGWDRIIKYYLTGVNIAKIY
ncbi:MAG: hypothetical protein NT136_03785 [Candidatus Moranbacteria bacterium]|nr:hypothetical protein [Candidatus Moranbacteria bacterium]